MFRSHSILSAWFVTTLGVGAILACSGQVLEDTRYQEARLSEDVASPGADERETFRQKNVESSLEENRAADPDPSHTSDPTTALIPVPWEPEELYTLTMKYCGDGCHYGAHSHYVSRSAFLSEREDVVLAIKGREMPKSGSRADPSEFESSGARQRMLELLSEVR